jgi:uncharacterized membrane protein
MARTRGAKTGIAFMVLWLVLWTGGMLIALYGVAVSIWHGNWDVVPFLGLWLVAAGFGLWSGARKLTQLMELTEKRPKPVRTGPHGWQDDMPAPRPGAAPDRPER